MAAKTSVNLIIENTVAQGATATDNSAIVPAGKTVRLVRFGGYERSISANTTGIIALQWGQGAAWETIRVGGGPTPFDFILNRTFIGDGAKRFRIVRQNRDPALSAAKEMVAWVEAVVL